MRCVDVEGKLGCAELRAQRTGVGSTFVDRHQSLNKPLSLLAKFHS
jgi:hypothetical protein